jgi:hypothetical protein
MNRRIFMSYRQVDADYVATALHKELAEHFGWESVFMDGWSSPGRQEHV